MQVNSKSKVNFTGVIPVRVFVNGKETLDGKLIHKTCQAVVKGIAGPLCDKPDFKPVAAQLAVMDNDYKFARAFYGYSHILPDQKLTVSKFFKIITDRNKRGYIVTGAPSEKLSELGKEIGRAQRECKEYAVKDSPRLQSAKDEYWRYIAEVGNNLLYRIKETFSPTNLVKIGKYQQMDVHISVKPVKVKGKPDSKIKIENISFSDKK